MRHFRPVLLHFPEGGGVLGSRTDGRVTPMAKQRYPRTEKRTQMVSFYGCVTPGFIFKWSRPDVPPSEAPSKVTGHVVPYRPCRCEKKRRIDAGTLSHNPRRDRISASCHFAALTSCMRWSTQTSPAKACRCTCVAGAARCESCQLPSHFPRLGRDGKWGADKIGCGSRHMIANTTSYCT